jgi:integrase/recombinase XerD
MEVTRRTQSFPTLHDEKFEDTILITGWLIGKSERTKKTYKKVIKSFFEFHPRIRINTTTTAHITTFLKAAENRGVKSSTLNLYLNSLASLFNFSIKQNKIQQDPTAGLKNYRINALVWKKILSIEQIEQMLLKTSRPRDLLLIKVLFYLGVRVSEITTIEVADFAFHQDEPILNIKGKGSKIRQAPVGGHLWKEISAYIRKHELRRHDYLFSDEKDCHRKLSTFAIWRAIRAAAQKAKIYPMPSPHWFRHTSATMALEGGASIHVVKERLGHASLSTTQIYLHAKPEDGLFNYLPKLKKPRAKARKSK